MPNTTAFAESLVEAARQQIHQFDDDLEDWTPEARKAAVAVLRLLAMNASWYGRGDIACWRHDELSDLADEIESAVPASGEVPQ